MVLISINKRQQLRYLTMTTQKNYYQVLGVSKTASQEEIRTSFRKLALEFHPDRNKDPKAQAKFKEINEAYQTLSDPNKRADYDRFGTSSGANSQRARGFDGSDPFGGFGDIFDAFFDAFGNRSRAAPQQGSDILTEMTISFEEAVFGAGKDLEVGRVEPCGHCKGDGSEPGSQPSQCQNCNGMGQVSRVQRSIFGQFNQVSVCSQCRGTGKLITNPCRNCKASGREKRQRKITVQIPAGVEDGTQVCLPQGGSTGVNGGGPGDLYINLHVQPHELFQRRDHEILYELPINMAEAVLGLDANIPTLNGNENLRIPEGTQAGTIFRIKGKGVPYSQNGKRRGDQLVVVNVVTPRKINGRQRELFKELADTLGDSSNEGKDWLGKIRESLGMDT